MYYTREVRTIPQRELRNHTSRVLREVEAGEPMRITVDGRPVADLVPLEGVRRTFVPREDVLRILRDAPLDPDFARDIRQLTDQTIDELS